MADRRRRRRRASQDSEEEEESGSGSESGRSSSPAGKSRTRVPEPVESPAVRVRTKSDDESECESEDAVGEAVLSDYDSADVEENGSHSEGGEDEEEGEHFSDEEAACPVTEQKAAADAPAEELAEEDVDEGQEEEEEEGGVKEVKAEKKGNLAGERQSGDGQESTDDPENKSAGKVGQKLDDDEDRKNPAYIPRKGLFFEHDVRGQAQDEERPKGRHRKLWKDEGRWEHDKFREEEQAPKSREELIAIYGYDIRNGTGASEGRPYRSRRPRHVGTPNQEPKRSYRDGEKPPRASWQGLPPGQRNTPPATMSLQSAAPPGPPRPQLRPSSQPSGRGFQAGRGPPLAPHRTEGRGHPRAAVDGYPLRGVRPQPPEGERAPRLRGRGPHGPRVERPGPAVPVETAHSEDDEEGEVPTVTTTYTAHQHRVEREATPSPRRQDAAAMADPASGPGPARESSPPPERPVEKKSYSLARRTRARPSDLSKQASLEDSAPAPLPAPTPVKNESWQGDTATQSGLLGLDQDLARLSLAGQNWAQSPPSYLRPEMRGIPNSMHMGGGPPQYANMEDMGVAGGRAKRYSSQRQRPVPEPAPMHIGVMEGHYYDPMSFQGPIYTHGDGPTPMPPQGLLVQPEMHLPHPTHPGLHPHQSGGPMPNPALYAAPPVSMSPGQPPQQLLPPPFYPPPGVVTFSNTNYPYPAGATLPPMYPNPQAQSQVYGGVTYFDTVQQQAQPKPSPPRRTSQPVTVKPPPPEDQSRKASEEVRS
ncbi:LOW QUALITY PROTEIN: protein CASC3 [Brachyhypopomus gauderio]|uniref:LOW QUALITY PROTEIN: protein CASC3 n=1 Tax=Brachyhypopomus gauderio TaxID=698409 RepID=UPI004042755A